MVKKRADLYLVEIGLAPSREYARNLILSGNVTADGKPVIKPSTLIDPSSHIRVAERQRYVSRGGYKLERALSAFGISADGKECIDIGASTGGFTDCLLQRGARHVVAIDVGYGQLSWSLRQDERVTVLERANIRHITPEQLPYKADLIVVDVSFISIEKILAPVKALLKSDSHVIALIKPQFEAGRERIGKKGVVSDPLTHIDVIISALGKFAEKSLEVIGLINSPIKGPEGNIEFLICAKNTSNTRLEHPIPVHYTPENVRNIVEAAHEELN